MKKILLFPLVILFLAGCNKETPESEQEKIQECIESFFSTSSYRGAEFEIEGYEKANVTLDSIKEYRLNKEILDDYLKLYEDLKAHIAEEEASGHQHVPAQWRCDEHGEDHETLLKEYEKMIVSFESAVAQVKNVYTSENYLAKCLIKQNSKCMPAKFYINNRFSIISYETDRNNTVVCE